MFHLLVAAALAADPDPSLRWLDRAEPSLEWVAGEPVLPPRYTGLEAGRARTVAGHMHAQGGAPTVVGRTGGLEVLRTPHGVLVRDPAAARWGWLWVSRTSPTGKLRHATVLGAEIRGDSVAVQLAGEPVADPTWTVVGLRDGRPR